MEKMRQREIEAQAKLEEEKTPKPQNPKTPFRILLNVNLN